MPPLDGFGGGDWKVMFEVSNAVNVKSRRNFANRVKYCAIYNVTAHRAIDDFDDKGWI